LRLELKALQRAHEREAGNGQPLRGSQGATPSTTDAAPCSTPQLPRARPGPPAG
jgi:hypothetical protein